MKEKAAILTINEILLRASLGWTAEERAVPQAVKVKIVMAFPETPAATRTDDLKDTVDYDTLTKDLVKFCETSTFNLIERLARASYEFIRFRLPEGTLFQIHVTKAEPPVVGITGGVTFTYGDPIPT